MKNTCPNPDNNQKRSTSNPAGQAESSRSGLPRPMRSTGKSGRDPIEYENHPYPSMKRFAGHLVLSHDTARTRDSYYRQMRLIHEHFRADPESLVEEQVRDYILHVKTRKGWRPKTIRQAAAAARLFYVGMLGREEWKLFSQVAGRMRLAASPMPHTSLQRLLVEARTHLGIPGATVHSLRHSFATHLVEAGASMHTVQALLGHKNINTTMVCLHLTHRSEQDCRELVEKLCRELPR